MKQYESPELEIVHIESVDIVTASDPKQANQMDIFSKKDL